MQRRLGRRSPRTSLRACGWEGLTDSNGQPDPPQWPTAPVKCWGGSSVVGWVLHLALLALKRKKLEMDRWGKDAVVGGQGDTLHLVTSLSPGLARWLVTLRQMAPDTHTTENRPGGTPQEPPSGVSEER